MNISNAVERVHQSYADDFRRIVESVAENLEPVCESPIELMLATAIEVANFCAAPDKLFQTILPGQEPQGNYRTLVYPQYQWEGYRIDFYLETPLLKLRLFVECDGHEFHERTPEQAERDRRKDRLIQEHGISILRFTGREIYRSPADCVIQIMSFISSRIPRRGGE